MTQKSIRLLIVDDQAIVRKGTMALLAQVKASPSWVKPPMGKRQSTRPPALRTGCDPHGFGDATDGWH